MPQHWRQGPMLSRRGPPSPRPCHFFQWTGLDRSHSVGVVALALTRRPGDAMDTTTETPPVERATSAFLRSLAAKRPSYDERLAAGKQLRSQVPRAAHAEYT